MINAIECVYINQDKLVMLQCLQKSNGRKHTRIKKTTKLQYLFVDDIFSLPANQKTHNFYKRASGSCLGNVTFDFPPTLCQ